MNNLVILLVLGTAYAALGAGSFPPPLPTTTTIKPNTTTSAPNTTTTSTTPAPAPNTTTTSTTPAPAPNTTTTSTTPAPAPNTTTTSTTPAPAPNTTTTSTTPAPAPNTTTVGPITTTAAPSGPGFWFVNITGTNRTCIIAKFAAHIVVNNTSIDVPKTAVATGDCGAKNQSITLTWNKADNITFSFGKRNDSKFDLEQIDINLSETVPGYNVSVWKFQHKKQEFVTPLKNSYLCKDQKLNLTSVNKVNVTASFHITDLQIEAFRNVTDMKFNQALDCLGGGTPDVVPIAVGCALAALVIIILAAYLIGRRRSQARGYTSM